MYGLASGIYRGSYAFSRAMIWIGVVALAALMLITVYDIVVRNTGISYVSGILEISRLALVASSALAFACAFFEGHHLVVEIGTHKMSPGGKARLEAVWLLLAVPVMAGLAWLTYREGLVLHADGTRTDNLGGCRLI